MIRGLNRANGGLGDVSLDAAADKINALSGKNHREAPCPNLEYPILIPNLLNR
jgi:hypothetical protein